MNEPTPFSQFTVNIDPSHPQLLEGLENWLQLGILNHEQVKSFCQRNLSCSLATEIAEQPSKITDFAEELTPEVATNPAQRLLSPVFQPLENTYRLFSQIWESWRAELSVRWLLFLGLFLVVVSSGVLAATQWEQFPSTGQYLVLFIYTLAFWGAGFWANRQENLELTARTLRVISLLLIPINFWAMDAFRLVNSRLGWGIIAIATLTLTLIYYHYARHRQRWLILLNFLALCYLQWGWNQEGFPLMAVYGATVVSGIIIQFLRIPKVSIENHPFKLDVAKGYIVYGLLLLLARAIFIVSLPLSQLGLAIGISGWLLPTEEESNEALAPILETLGALLLLWAWLSTFWLSFPWQATIITGLALHFFTRRLRKHWLQRDLLFLFLIGVQGLFLLWRLIPIRSEILATAQEISQSSQFPASVLSLLFFPSILIGVMIAGWLYRQDKAKLGLFGEELTLIWGMILTLIGFVNPLWRSLNLIFSALTLFYVTRRYSPLRLPLLYFSHLVALLSIISPINWAFPQLSLNNWGIVLLGLMVGEWGLSLFRFRRTNSPFQQALSNSCWNLGFLLALGAYGLFFQSLNRFLTTGDSQPAVLWWLLTPATLTGMAYGLPHRHKRRQVVILSSLALILEQILTITQPSIRLISLGLSAILMVSNSYYFRHPVVAISQIGFSLGFLFFWYWEGFSGSFVELLASPDLLRLNAITTTLLWLLSMALSQSRLILARIYAKATNGWAILLAILVLVRTSFHATYITVANRTDIQPNEQYLLVASVILGMLAVRYAKKPNNTAILGIFWALELLIVHSVWWFEGGQGAIASVNVIVGLLALPVTHWVSSRHSRFSSLISWQIFPLFLAFFALLWRINDFNQYTFLITLGVAIIGIGVGYRLYHDRIITYSAIVGISVAIYEGVIYRLIERETPLVDGLLTLTLITGSIAIFYQLLASIWHLRQKSHVLNLSLARISLIADWHWGIAGLLKISSIILVILGEKATLSPLSLTLTLFLSVYALIQGRGISAKTTTFRTKAVWVYLGCSDVVVTAILARLIWWKPLQVLDPYLAAIVAVIALIISYLPWERWGWSEKPWHRIATIVPIFIALVTANKVSDLSLLCVAAFYLQLSIHHRQIRWSYLSLALLGWIFCRFLGNHEVFDLLWYTSVMGLLLIYIAQVDPYLRQSQQRRIRHRLRLSGSGLICVVALLFHQETGIIPAVLSLITVFVGLGLQIRAFLFMGTITFMLTVVYQLLVLSFEYAFVKWIIGLMVGIWLIIIAAKFEQRREQIRSVWQNWRENWQEWD